MISKTLKAAIQACGKSLSQIERDCGLSSGTLSRFIGGRDIGISSIDRITDYLGLHLVPTREMSEIAYKRTAAIREETQNATNALREAERRLALVQQLTDLHKSEEMTEYEEVVPRPE